MCNRSTAMNVIVAALRRAAGRPAAAALAVSGDDLRDALTIAIDCKILSMVGSALDDDPKFHQVLVDYTARTIANNSVLLQVAGEVTGALAAEHIRACIVKGPLQQKLIHGTFYARPAGDLDILVTPRNFAKAGRILIDLGFERATPSIWWRSSLGEEHYERAGASRIAVDLHHRTGQPGVVGSLSAAALIDESIDVPVGNDVLPAASKEMALLLSAISVAKAQYNREPSAAYLADLFAGVMADFPRMGGSLLELARRHHLFGVASVALRLVDAVYGPLDLPAAIATRLSDLPQDQLFAMIFCPAAPETRWPRRREFVWEFSDERAVPFIREWLLIGRSELMRRLFERAGAKAVHRA